jgi:hypothetical protein
MVVHCMCVQNLPCCTSVNSPSNRKNLKHLLSKTAYKVLYANRLELQEKRFLLDINLDINNVQRKNGLSCARPRPHKRIVVILCGYFF